MPNLDKGKQQYDGPDAQDDPRINPDGIYSGMTKRLAQSDGSFVDIGGMPKDSRRSRRSLARDQD